MKYSTSKATIDKAYKKWVANKNAARDRARASRARKTVLISEFNRIDSTLKKSSKK